MGIGSYRAENWLSNDTKYVMIGYILKKLSISEHTIVLVLIEMGTWLISSYMLMYEGKITNSTLTVLDNTFLFIFLLVPEIVFSLCLKY